MPTSSKAQPLPSNRQPEKNPSLIKGKRKAISKEIAEGKGKYPFHDLICNCNLFLMCPKNQEPSNGHSNKQT